jgi:hypothetical protein
MTKAHLPNWPSEGLALHMELRKMCQLHSSLFFLKKNAEQVPAACSINVITGLISSSQQRVRVRARLTSP